MAENVHTIKLVGLAMYGTKIVNVVYLLVLNAHRIQNGMAKLVNAMQDIMLITNNVLNVKMAINLMAFNVLELPNLSYVKE